MSDLPKIKVVVDTREGETGYSFSKWADAEVIRSALPTGDYSLVGFEDRISLERKTLDDLIGCLGKDRDRFQKELQSARKFEHFAVIIEVSLPPIMVGRYRSKMNSNCVLQSIAAFSILYKASFLFCGDRPSGEFMVYSLLSTYAHEITKRYQRFYRGMEIVALK